MRAIRSFSKNNTGIVLPLSFQGWSAVVPKPKPIPPRLSFVMSEALASLPSTLVSSLEVTVLLATVMVLMAQLLASLCSVFTASPGS